MALSSAFIKRLRDIMRQDAGVTGDAQRIEQLSWILFLKVYDAKEEDWEFLDEGYRSIIPERLRWRNWAANAKGALTGQPLLDFVDRDLFPTLKALPVSPSTPRRQTIVRETFEEANNYMKDGTLLRMVLNEVDAAINLSDTKQAHLLGNLYESLLRELQAAGAAGEFYTPRPVTDFMARAIRPQIGERMADFACGTGGFLTSWLKAMPAPKTPAEQAAIGASVFGIEKKQFPHRLCVTNLLLHDIDAPNILHGNALTQKNLLDYDDDDRFDVVLMNPPYGGTETAAVRSYFPKDLTGSETADLFVALILYRLKPGGRAAVVLPDGFLFGNDAVKRALKQRLLDDFNLHTVVRLPPGVFAPYTSITTNLLFFDRSGPTRETWFYRLPLPQGGKPFSKTRPMPEDFFAPLEAWWDHRTPIRRDGVDLARAYTPAELRANDLNLDLCGPAAQEEEILPIPEALARYQAKRAEVDARIAALTAKLHDLLP